MSKLHQYQSEIVWTGNLGTGTSSYKDYERSYTISSPQKPVILGSSDPMFRGEASKYNPEDLLLSSLSACHMLWYLHFCSDKKIIVEEYKDNATATMQLDPNGSGKFIEATLHPVIKIKSAANIQLAHDLHEQAHKFCFIANSLNFDVSIKPTITSSEV